MNTVFKIMAFSIVFNFAIGIMMGAILDSNGCQVFGNDPSSGCYDPSRRGGLNYNESYAVGFTSPMENTVNPTGTLEDKGNAIYRVLDMLNLGFISRFLDTVKQYMYGFIALLDDIIGGYLTPSIRTLVFGWPFGALYTLLTIGYIYGAWVLWTGKDINS